MIIIEKSKTRRKPGDDRAICAGFTPKMPRVRDPLAYAAVLKALG